MKKALKTDVFKAFFIVLQRKVLSFKGYPQNKNTQCPNMTNSAFQSGGELLKKIWALAVDLLKCEAKAERGVLQASPL